MCVFEQGAIKKTIYAHPLSLDSFFFLFFVGWENVTNPLNACLIYDWRVENPRALHTHTHTPKKKHPRTHITYTLGTDIMQSFSFHPYNINNPIYFFFGSCKNWLVNFCRYGFFIKYIALFGFTIIVFLYNLHYKFVILVIIFIRRCIWTFSKCATW